MHSSQAKPDTTRGAITTNVFHREGEYWTIAYEALVVRLRDTKGLRCLAQLLRQPGRHHPARDLLATVIASRRPFQRTMARTQEAEDEHARIVVTKHLKAAIRKIQILHEALGYHLGTTIKTGHACAYVPDPTRPTLWTVGGWEQVS